MAGIWSPWIHRQGRRWTLVLSFLVFIQLWLSSHRMMLSTFRVGPFTPTQFIGCLTDRFSVELTASTHHLKKPVLLYIAYYLNLTFFPPKVKYVICFFERKRETERRWLQERPGWFPRETFCLISSVCLNTLIKHLHWWIFHLQSCALQKSVYISINGCWFYQVKLSLQRPDRKQEHIDPSKTSVELVQKCFDWPTPMRLKLKVGFPGSRLLSGCKLDFFSSISWI